jgi:hypothetical protein
MRRTVLPLILVASFTPGVANSRVVQLRDARDSIEWPRDRDEFPTLQSAIDALRDGGRLKVSTGRFDLREPLIVRNKRITFEGAGCGEALPLGKTKTDRFTHLAGPRPERITSFGEVAGLLTYVGTGGGVVRGLKLSGFDAGIRIVANDTGEVSRATLTVEDTCIAETGRGIVSSAPAGKIVAQNVLIRDVLWNGISISPSVFGTLFQSIFTSFGLAVVNTGQACVVMKNSAFTAFQNHFDACGYNGGPPGLGGGLLAVNAGVNFIESTTNVTNGPGIAANGGTTLIQHTSVIRSALGAGILLFEPLYAQLKESHVLLTAPFPAGHVHAGNFGDGVIVAGQGTVWVGDSLIHTNARAGVSNLGSFVDLGSSKLTCNGFDLEGEPYPLSTDNFLFNDRGGNKCGCPLASQECEAVSAVFVPPLPVQVVE